MPSSSNSLKQILEEIEKHDVDVPGWIEGFTDRLRERVLSNNYYWGLAAYVDLYKPQRVLELGTCTGASAVLMARAGAVVDTYDLFENKWELDFWPENVHRHIADDPRYIHHIDFPAYDMIFIDIDHSGKDELKIHRLLEEQYQGIVFYDDIWLTEGMRALWEQIKQEKQACQWHGRGGFGLVRYRKK